jgi:hypothetical protein
MSDLSGALNVLERPDPVNPDQVVQRMQLLQTRLPAGDGIGWFNKLYVKVTQEVQLAAAGTAFRTPAFVATLDVVFSGLYFRALRTYLTDEESTPGAWWPLFQGRGNTHVRSLQFALAGMNAHINRDLAVALKDTCVQLGIAPRRGTDQYADYEQVNQLLAGVEGQVKAWFTDGTIATLDRALGPIDDLAAIWSIGRAREAAWEHGVELWERRDDAAAYAGKLRLLDGIVGLTSRALLLPTQ